MPRSADASQGMPIFVISLPDAHARRQAVSENMRALGLTFEFFDAVDGRAGPPTLRDGERVYPDDCVRHYPLLRTKPLGSAEIACYLSHFRLIQRCLADGLQRALVLEDDMAGLRDLPEALRALSGLPQSYELIRLYQLFFFGGKNEATLLDARYRIRRPRRGVVSACAYCVSRQGMQRIARQLGDVHQPFDVAIDRFWETGLRCFCVLPSLMRGPRRYDSYLQADRAASIQLRWRSYMRAIFYKFKRHGDRLRYVIGHFREFF